jgi:MFS superfamily sulfate permease-like transporter
MGLAAAADPPLRWLILAGSAIGDVDYSGADAVRAVHDELATRGVTLVLADFDPLVMRLLDAYGLTDKIGKANVYPTTRDAADAYQRTPPPAS